MTRKQNYSIHTNYPIHKSVIRRFTKKTTVELYEKLIKKKAEVQNRPYASKYALSLLGREKGGDQADQVSRLQEEARHSRANTKRQPSS